MLRPVEFKTEFLKHKGEGPLVIAAVGAGGKTTLLKDLYEVFRPTHKTALTTTVKMGEDPRFTADPKTITERLDLDNGAWLGRVHDASHVRGLEPDELSAVVPRLDVLLIEADGAKRHPLKVPLDHEPVLPESTDVLLLLAGFNAVGQTFQDACFRLERALTLVDKRPEDTIEIEDLATLLVRGYLKNQRLTKQLQKTAVYCVLSQGDVPGAEAAFQTFKAQIQLLAPEVEATKILLSGRTKERRFFKWDV